MVYVQILLDSGSSDNFLQPQIGQHLKLLMEPILSLHVLVSNGNALLVEELMKEVTVLVQGHKLTLRVYVLFVMDVDMVLGASWLATLGPHIFYYSTLLLKFYLGGAFITLCGEKKSTLLTLAQYHHTRRFLYIQARAKLFVIQLQLPDVSEDVGSTFPPNIHPCTPTRRCLRNLQVYHLIITKTM